jgi:hypothetical protein
MPRALAAGLVAGLGLVPGAAQADGIQPRAVEPYRVLPGAPARTSVTAMAGGPDGAMWLVTREPMPGRERRRVRLYRVTNTGAISSRRFVEHVSGGEYAYPAGLIAARGSLWISWTGAFGGGTDHLTRIRMDGRVERLPLTPAPDGEFPSVTFMGAGSNGSLWFSAARYLPPGGWIGQLNPDGAISYHPVPRALGIPLDIAVSKGAVWFSGFRGRGRIGRVDQAGRVTQRRLPTRDYPGLVEEGPGSSAWVRTESHANHDVLYVTERAVRRFDLRNHHPGAMAAGRGGRLFFIDYASERHRRGDLARLTTAGDLRTCRLPRRVLPADVAVARDGAAWVSGALGRAGRTVVVRLDPERC